MLQDYDVLTMFPMAEWLVGYNDDWWKSIKMSQKQRSLITICCHTYDDWLMEIFFESDVV